MVSAGRRRRQGRAGGGGVAAGTLIAGVGAVGVAVAVQLPGQAGAVVAGEGELRARRAGAVELVAEVVAAAVGRAVAAPPGRHAAARRGALELLRAARGACARRRRLVAAVVAVCATTALTHSAHYGPLRPVDASVRAKPGLPFCASQIQLLGMHLLLSQRVYCSSSQVTFAVTVGSSVTGSTRRTVGGISRR